MFKLLVVLTIVFMNISSHAAVRVFNGNTDLDIVQAIKCVSPLTCTKTRTTANFALSSGVLGQSALVAATATTITAAQCGSTFYNTAAVEMDLPEASTVPGCTLTFVTLNASNFDVDPEAADQILVLTNAAGDMIRNATLGNTVTLEAVSPSQWVVVGEKGTWTDNN